MKAFMSNRKGETNHRDVKLYEISDSPGEGACGRTP
jgi:hypothetical protein